MEIEKETNIQRNDFFCKNEINISEILKKYDFFYDYFTIIIDYDYAKIADIKNSCFNISNSLNDNSNTNEFIIVKRNIPEIRLSFLEYFNSDILNYNILISNIINSYDKLLNNIFLLNSNNILHININHETIIINKITQQPVITDIKNTIMFPTEISILEHFLKKYNEKKYFLTPEFHLIMYMIQNEKYSSNIIINNVIIKNISDNIINYNPIFNYFSTNFKNRYRNLVELTLQSYQNISIQKLLEKSWKTYNLFSISVLYLLVICKVSKVHNINTNSMKKLIKQLLINIHPDFKERR